MTLRRRKSRGHASSRRLREHSAREQRPATPPSDGLTGLGELFGRLRAWPGKWWKGLPGRWHAEQHQVAAIARRDASWRSRWSRTLSTGAAIFASTFLLAILVDVIEPFGLDNAMKAYSGRISARMMAPFYQSRGQDRIAVVLIDQQTLDVRQQPWPPRYEYYENVLRRILRQRPAGVYFDILTSDTRPYDDSLQDARMLLADELESSGVPVWFGVISPTASSVFSGVPGTRTAVAGWKGLGADYPLRIAPANLIVDNQPMHVETQAPPPAESVAYTLYRRACLESHVPCSSTGAPLTPDQASTPMVLHWGLQRPLVPTDLATRLGSCVRPDGTEIGFVRKLGQAAAGAWHDFWSGFDPEGLDRHREPCPPVLTVLEQQLDDPGIAALLEGRMVLVGTRLAALDDSVLSPVHQRVPGVYAHAMALDNLMTWGSDRLQRNTWLARGFSWTGLLVVSVLVAWVLRSLGGWRRRAALVGVGLLGVVGTTWFLQAALRQPPLDWLGAAALLGTVVLINSNRTKGE